jgi:hypothetical protein
MKKTYRKVCNKIVTRVLTLLGFCSTFVFMACYGPAPTKFDYADMADSVDVALVDEVNDSLGVEEADAVDSSVQDDTQNGSDRAEP